MKGGGTHPRKRRSRINLRLRNLRSLFSARHRRIRMYSTMKPGGSFLYRSAWPSTGTAPGAIGGVESSGSPLQSGSSRSVTERVLMVSDNTMERTLVEGREFHSPSTDHCILEHCYNHARRDDHHQRDHDGKHHFEIDPHNLHGW